MRDLPAGSVRGNWQSGLADDVLATYNDGSACLVCDGLRRRRAGRAERRPGGLGTARQVDVRAAGAIAGGSHHEPRGRPGPGLLRRAAGGPVAAGGSLGQRPADCRTRSRRQASRHQVPTAPDAYGELVEEGAGVVWNWRAPDRPGVYRVCRDEATRLRAGDRDPAPRRANWSISRRT